MASGDCSGGIAGADGAGASAVSYTHLDVYKRQRNTLGVYEMGSTFKIFNTALALDSGLVKITDQFDPRIPIKVGGFVIHDYEPVSYTHLIFIIPCQY